MPPPRQLASPDGSASLATSVRTAAGHGAADEARHTQLTKPASAQAPAAVFSNCVASLERLTGAREHILYTLYCIHYTLYIGLQ